MASTIPASLTQIGPGMCEIIRNNIHPAVCILGYQSLACYRSLGFDNPVGCFRIHGLPTECWRTPWLASWAGVRLTFCPNDVCGAAESHFLISKTIPLYLPLLCCVSVVSMNPASLMRHATWETPLSWVRIPLPRIQSTRPRNISFITVQKAGPWSTTPHGEFA